jgi:hypothetical protein
MTYGGHSEVTKGSYNCLSVQEAGAWHARALEGGEMEGRNRIRLEGFWEGLTNQELHAGSLLRSRLHPTESVVKDCYECALLAFCLPTRSRQASSDIVVAGLFMKRCLNQLRAVWLLLNQGYTSEAAAVAASLFEAPSW